MSRNENRRQMVHSTTGETMSAPWLSERTNDHWWCALGNNGGDNKGSLPYTDIRACRCARPARVWCACAVFVSAVRSLLPGLWCPGQVQEGGGGEGWSLAFMIQVYTEAHNDPVTSVTVTSHVPLTTSWSALSSHCLPSFNFSHNYLGLLQPYKVIPLRIPTKVYCPLHNMLYSEQWLLVQPPNDLNSVH